MADEDERTGTRTDGRPPPQGERVVRLPRHRDGNGREPDLHETFQGSKPGSRFLRRTRERDQKLRRVSEGEFEARPAVLRPATPLGRAWNDLRHFFLGRALASSELSEERLSKLKALPIFSSDALSSSAYATEEILLVLIAAGAAATTQSIYISLAIALLAAIVVVSYRQTIRAYPNGGGAYIVAKENLSVGAGLVAGSALLVDYIMTVAVSTAAGVAAVTSAAPDLHPYRIEVALLFVALITLGNLRGIRESGTIFAIPTYFFIFTFGTMLIVGLGRIALGADLKAAVPDDPTIVPAATLGPILLLRAFSSGAAALTGIEAVANGVPSFKPPEAKNAIITQTWMAVILVCFFVGTTLLAHQLEVAPAESMTVIAQIAETVFDFKPLFYVVQVATALILVLAANTAFAGLPNLASVMAREGVMPKQFAFRGDRLAFSNGIILLGVASSAVLIFFDADTHKIIPLYAFGVFMAFTLSQLGMVVHWRRHPEPGWRGSLMINAVGAVATGVVAVIVGYSKFSHGAWLSIAIMIVIVGVLWLIRNHYRDAEAQLDAGLRNAERVADYFYGVSAGRPQTVIVPVDEINRAVLRTVAYARTLSQGATAIHVTDEREAAERLRRQWEVSVPDVPLIVVESPYRSLVEPIIAWVEALDRTQPNQMVTVVLPEFVPRRFWQRFLHNQLSVRLKKALLSRPNTVVVDVPYHLR